MADGTITLETKADEKGVKVGMKEIEASVKRMSSSVEGLGEKAKIALQKQLDSLSKLNNQYGQQEQKVEALRKRLKELSDQKIETEEYKRFGAEIKKLDNEFEKVEQKQREWLDMGFPADSMKNLDDQLDEIWAKMDKLQKKQAEMKSSGIAYVDPRSLSEYQSTASRLTVEEMRLDDMNNRLNTSFATTEMKLKECGEEAARSSSKFSGLAESARRFAEKLKQSGITGMKQKLHELWQALDKLMSKFMQLASGAIVGGLQKISGGIFAIHKSANKSTLSLKNLLKYAFGIRSLFALFNKLRGAIGEGIQNLAKYDLATQTGDVNTCLSELQSALTQLKNSFSTAFAPILTVVSPILVNFINLISQAVTRVGMLIAALTGQKTFVKAIAVQENYAASLDKTANSAKKAAKALQGYLSPIDEINRYDDGSSSDSGSGSGGGYSGPSAGDMFEEVPIESSLKGIADKIKELIQNEDWEGLGAYIADGINKGLQKIYNVINWDTMNNFIQTLQHRGDIISGSAEEIWQLKESLEQEGMTAEDKASATQKLIDKLGEMGVTSDQAEQAFSSLYQQGLITDDMFDILSESIKTLGDNTTNMAGSIDLGKQSIDDLYNNVLPQLQVQLGLSADEMVQLDTALMEAENSGGTAQDAFNRIMERAKELGINTESVAKIFAEVFPEAVRETESSAKTSMDNTKKSVETGMGAASAAIGNAMSGIKTDTEKAMSETERSVSDHTGNISTATVTNWGNSAEEVDKNLDQMKQHANLKLGEMHKTVESHFSSQYNTMTKKWERARDRIEQIISEMIRNMNIRLEGLAGNMEPVGTRIGNNLLSGISSGIRGITDTLNDVIRKVNTTVGNINNTIGNIERGFTFSYNVQLPNGGRRWGNYSLNLPRVNTVPYLATGAVIPPRSEFLAVLGDQKNGRNLEAPESLIRQIVREETGGKQGNNTYNVSVSASGRNLLDIVLEEGELRRNRNGGRNPFKLDD